MLCAVWPSLPPLTGVTERAKRNAVITSIRAVIASVAETAIIPVQDVLGLGSDARMNVPGRASGNWRWRFDWTDVPDALAATCRERAARAGRSS